MLRRTAVAAFMVLLLGACSSLPVSIAKQPGRALVKGVDTAPIKVMIRTIDGGDVLWVGNYKLGTEAWVTSGMHKLNVMCEFHNSWGNELMPGNVEIDAKEGLVYELNAVRTLEGKTCVIEVTQLT